MKTAVVILNYNGKHWLEKFLPSVVKYSEKKATIHIIDNQSNDDSISFLKENYPSINIIQNPENWGFTKGYNEGLKHINAEIFCLLNSDVEVSENWLNSPLKIFEENPNIAVIQPKILSFKQKDYFEFAGAAGGFMDNLGYPYCRGRIFNKTEKDEGQYDDFCEIFWASGCCMFIRSEIFFKMNGFDPRFFAHQEEIDLCWRIQNEGYKIFYTYESKVYHFGGGTLNYQNPKKTYLNIRNNLSTLLKNLPFRFIFPVIFIRLFLDGIAGLYFGLKNSPAHIIAVIKAHFSFYAMIPKNIKLRQKKQITAYYKTK